MPYSQWIPYKNTLPIDSGIPVELIVVLQASVFLYGLLETWQSPVYCYSLENCRVERHREFESHRFRQVMEKRVLRHLLSTKFCVIVQWPVRKGPHD